MALRRRWILANIAMWPLAGCASVPGAVSEETIVLEAGPCFWGTCPAYTIRVDPAGVAIFTGKAATAFEGERSFLPAATQLAEFRSRVTRYRPDGQLELASQRACREMWTDQPSITVTWLRDGKEQSSLFYYAGCDPNRHRAMAEALFNAYKSFPEIAPLIEK